MFRKSVQRVSSKEYVRQEALDLQASSFGPLFPFIVAEMEAQTTGGSGVPPICGLHQNLELSLQS